MGIKNASGSQMIMGNIQFPGFASIQSAYHSEITGIYRLVIVIKISKDINLKNLGRLALLNVEMDYWAKDYWAEQYDSRKYFTYEVPKGMWKIAMLGTRVCKHLVAYLRESIEGGKAAEYWVFKRKRFNEEGYFQVDWETNRVAMKSVPIGRRQWVTKFESGMCGTGKMMELWKKRLVNNCPRCVEEN